MRSVRLPVNIVLRCLDHRGQLQSPVWLSIHPASVFFFMMESEEKPSSHGYLVAKEKENAHRVV